MRCPVDNETLVMADRNGVEIDYCPRCRGVWLDRGELDKIIERSAAAEPPVALREPARAAVQSYGAEARPDPRRDDHRREDPRDSYRKDDRRRRDDDDDEDEDKYRRPRKRRESFLSDLFDF